MIPLTNSFQFRIRLSPLPGLASAKSPTEHIVILLFRCRDDPEYEVENLCLVVLLFH